MSGTRYKTRVVVPRGPGGPDVLAVEDRVLPAPAEGQVAIRVRYAGVNRHDCGQRSRGAPPAGATDVLGLEVAGEIIAAGPGVAPSRVGEPVAALVNGGGYAEVCLADSALAWVYPRTLTPEQAAALPEALLTVWLNVVRLGGLQSGQVLLVHGGTSGVGSIAIQVGKLLGAAVIATAGSDEKCAKCLELGADRAVNYRTGDFVAVARGLGGANVILDMAGGTHAERNLGALAMDGAVVHISSGTVPTWAAPLRLISEKRARVTGSLLRPTSVAFKAALAAEMQAVCWPELGQRIRPLIDGLFALSDAAAAHQRMEAGEHMGKILLDPSR